MRIEQIGDATLYLGDCREVLLGLPQADAVVTDPPYGLNLSGGVGKYGKIKWGGERDKKWDYVPPSKDTLEMIRNKSTHQIFWGGHLFDLPNSSAWLIWDKGAGFKNRCFSEAEMAWTSLKVRIKIFQRDPLAAHDYVGKVHPTQKPVPVMVWCIKQLPGPNGSIMDPYMGSGTTGVAAINLGRKFIGIELNTEYFDIACRRIEKAWTENSLLRTA